MPTHGICLRVTHTGQARSSILIADVEDATDEKPDLIKSGPVYVPYKATVEMVYSSAVARSFENGNIRGFINTGDLVARFIFNTLPQQGAIGYALVTGAAYTADTWDRNIGVCTVGSPVTIQLPPVATHATKQMLIVDALGNAAVNNITVLPAPGDTINGAASAVINTNHGVLDLYGDCVSDWFPLSTGGAGTTDHRLLLPASLVWTASAHTGPPNTIAGFDGAGAAIAVPLPTGTSQLLWGDNSVGSSTTTRYLTPGYDDGLAETIANQIRAVRAGTLRNLRVRHNVTKGNGNNIVYTLRVNGVATALSATVASTVNDGADLANSVVIAAGDRLDFVVTKAAGVGSSPNNIVATVEFV